MNHDDIQRLARAQSVSHYKPSEQLGLARQGCAWLLFVLMVVFVCAAYFVL